MPEAWEQWEGEVVNGEFPLRQYLGGCDHSGVFLTEQVEREPQKAAIKLVLADRERAELQLRRWELAAKLSHPHLIRLFRFGRCQLGNMGLLYIVMEYAEENLSQVLVHRPITPAEAHEMLGPALAALAYVHGKGFVHGHMKPANILAVNDQLKVSVDGVYRSRESGGSLEWPGAYDPPEITGRGITPAGDVWSLGMTLVEALTQRLTVWEREREEPALPQTLPSPFLDFARHCLQRDPQRRWTVAEITAWLRQTSTATQEKMTARTQTEFAKWRFVAPLVAVGLALLAMVAGLRLFNHRPGAQGAPSIALEQTRAQPKQEPVVVTPETVQSRQRAKDEESAPRGTAPTPLRREAGTKTRSGGLVLGEVVHQVLPNVPRKARDTIQGTLKVRVRVRVDSSGSVKVAMLDSPGPSRYFAELALRAARQWKFRSAKVEGRDVSSEWILRFEFGRSATSALSVPATP